MNIYKELYNKESLRNRELIVHLLELDDCYIEILRQRDEALHDTEKLMLENERLKNIVEGVV